MIVYREERKIAELSEYQCSLEQIIMKRDEIHLVTTTMNPLSIQEGDYCIHDNVRYTINRSIEFKQDSEIENTHTIIFEAPIYRLLDKIYCNKLTGSTRIVLTGTLRDFLELLIWNINKTTENPLGVDSDWKIGKCENTEFQTLIFDGVSCRAVLDELAKQFNLEYYTSGDGKTVNFVRKIENQTDRVFSQGRGNGLYTLTQQNIDSQDVVTRVYPKGGTQNVMPGEGDEIGRLELPEKYIENFSDVKRVVEKTVSFKKIHPQFIGTVSKASGKNNVSFVCQEIDFDLKELAVGNELRVNFLTGDLMGNDFELNWNNKEKKITIIEKEDTLSLVEKGKEKHLLPNALRKLKDGDTFSLTGLSMPSTYREHAIQRLRKTAQDWLELHCRRRVKYLLEIDSHLLRNEKFNIGDLIRVKDEKRGINALLRITQLTIQIGRGDISCVVSNYIDEKWEKKIEGQISSIQQTITSGANSIQGTSVDIIEEIDGRESTDSRVYSSKRSDKNLSELQRTHERRFLSKDREDIAQGLITLLKGAKFGEYLPGITGYGGFIDSKGRAELESLILRGFLEVPEYRYNRVTIKIGEEWHAKGAGIIESVDTERNTFRLKLEEGELPSLEEDDICKCIFHHRKGFATSYFSVKRVHEDGVIEYKLRPESEVHPFAMANIVAYGNFTKKERQSPYYSTTNYIRYLTGVDDWEIKNENIAMQFGDLSNLTIAGRKLEGYSAYLNNVYISGIIKQLPDIVKKEVEKITLRWQVIPVNAIEGAPLDVNSNESLRGGDGSLRIRVKYLRNDIDVTNIMSNHSEPLFQFKRVSLRGVDDANRTDEAWNKANEGRTEITLSPEDVMYSCTIITEYDVEQLENIYNGKTNE